MLIDKPCMPCELLTSFALCFTQFCVSLCALVPTGEACNGSFAERIDQDKLAAKHISHAQMLKEITATLCIVCFGA